MQNRYPGTCQTCSEHVPAGAGVVVRESGRWRAYCCEHEPRPDPPPPRGDHAGWHTTALAGYDCETSAPNPEEAFVVSAALVDVQGQSHTWLVDPGEREIPAEAAAVHGISTEYARAHGRPATQVLGEISQALVDHLRAGRGLAVFNAPYDLVVLDRELRRADLPTVREQLDGTVCPVIDPLVLDRGLDPYRRGRRNLESMCQHYGIALNGAHTATGDARACVDLAVEIGARYRDVAELALPELHERQVEWARAYARGRQEWLDRTRPGHGQTIDGTWPMPSTT
ncbi:exonuclease domain-containing protein [Lipingzhangella sp. LS1_29]|uniref:Exonuclease domain-containing protein n=1 Tax=Lipingzhangella rawalii TaxID=2055835 RepID=A0ABU2H4M9_9ACTN|nr:exonuclease domain-containing protein [Lipingzhangella rawalii]MDS1270268.1 exonuclease domain-containing protein [Lipingzhangella rawalii]